MSAGRVFVGLALNGLLCVLSYLVPERRNTLLLGGGLAKSFSGNPKYFYLHLCRRRIEGGAVSFDFSWIPE